MADSITSIVVRTISTVCRSVMARVSSRGAVPKTSVEMACGASGCRNHSVKAAMPAWATRPIQERFSGGMARYQGSVSSMRAMAWAASEPDDCASVAVCGWAGRASGRGVLVSGSGTGQDCLIRTAGRVLGRAIPPRPRARAPVPPPSPPPRAGPTVEGVMDVRRASERDRGGDPAAGIESWHSLSFGPHYDPDNLRFGAVIACNEEHLGPGRRLRRYPHSHTEIVTWLLGELTHRDSTGRETVSSEAAARITVPVRFLLQWHDERVPRDQGLALYDALASQQKTLHANPGGHAEVPPSEQDGTLRFFARHLAR
ncbi:hypothetical protein SALBM217S_09305 [Streptomyces griseoloalbus]